VSGSVGIGRIGWHVSNGTRERGKENGAPAFERPVA